MKVLMFSCLRDISTEVINSVYKLEFVLVVSPKDLTVADILI